MTTIHRLNFEDLDPKLAQVLEPRVTRLGYLGEFFRIMGHQPTPLRAFVEYTESAKSGLDKRLVEIVALTVAKHKANRYELNQHERLCVRHGFGREWITTVETLDPQNAALLSNLEKLIQQFVIAAVEARSELSTRLFQAIVERLGAHQAVAILMVIGRYVAHAVMVEALGIEPPVPSIFEDDFGNANSSTTI